MVFQKLNGTCWMKPERSGWNLAEKSGTSWDLKWNENYSILFYFLNWYWIFRSFQAKQNGIDNFSLSFFAFGSTYIRMEKTKWEILISLNRALSSHVNLCSHKGWWWNILKREKGNFPCDLRPSKIF